MIGTELPAWRRRHGYTQQSLCMELGIHSRQTIISWEKSAERLSRVVELALIALEKIPEIRKAAGERCSGPAEYREQRARPTDPRHP